MLLRCPALLLAASLISSALAAEPYIPRDSQAPGEAPPSPKEAEAAITLLPGFEATLFAGEPDVHQPINMHFDDRGRLWVAESYSYKEWKSLGEDRLVIFEDRDHDGRFDSRSVFPYKFNHLTSAVHGFGGIWVLDTPNLLFIPDANRDDIPDGPAEIIIDGWTKRAGHNFVNGLTWGPDGWLYGRHGITAPSRVGAPGTPEEDRLLMDCSIWRIHPTRRASSFEIVTEGTTNPWGLDWDENGECFFSNNVNGHLYHAVPGARFIRMHGSGFHRHAYELMPMSCDHLHHAGGWTDRKNPSNEDLGGGHSHCGLMIYQGSNWPAPYRGKAFMCNTHGRRINMDALYPEGSVIRAGHQPDFMRANQPWFRGISLLSGPDGSVYVSDWVDNGECHDNDGVHRSSGRIYRITHKKPRPLREPDLQAWPIEDLAHAAMNREIWIARTARRILQERKAAEVWPQLLDHYQVETNTPIKLRLLQAMASIDAPACDAAFLTRQLDDPTPAIRIWAMRFLRDQEHPLSEAIATRLDSETDPLALRHLAGIVTQRLPVDQRLSVLQPLLIRELDQHLELQTWYAIEPAVAAQPEVALSMLETIHSEKLRRFVARRLASTQYIALMDQALSTDDPVLMFGVADGLKGRRKLTAPEGWNTRIATLSSAMAHAAEPLKNVFQGGETPADLKARLSNPAVPYTERVAALNELARHSSPDFTKLLKSLIRDNDLRGAAIAVMCSKPAWGRIAISEMRNGRIHRSEISAFQARQLDTLGLGTEVAKLWGEVRKNSADMAKEIAAQQTRLTPEVLAKADRKAGAIHYQTLCATCHSLFGQGGKLGPELDGANRDDLYYLLENIMNPNAILPIDYRLSSVRLKDGRVLTGNAAAETEHTLTLSSQEAPVVLEKKNIESRTLLETSTMPEGLLNALDDTQVRDLIAYLMLGPAKE